MQNAKINSQKKQGAQANEIFCERGSTTANESRRADDIRPTNEEALFRRGSE